MLKKIAVTLLGAVLLGGPGQAQNAPNPMAVVRAADAAIGATAAKSIRYGGVDGYIAVIGQSETPAIQDGWPRFHLKSFTRTIDFETNSMREEQVRTQGDNPAEKGGGQRPIVGERRSIALYRDGYAWNQNADGSVTARPEDVTARRLEIVMTPHGFIRAALQARDLKMEDHAESFRSIKRIRTISFKYMDKYPLTGWIDEANHVTKIQTWFPSPVVGDQFVETRYAQWKPAAAGFAFGPEVHQSVGIPPHPSYDFSATTLEFNVPGAALEIPASVRAATDNSGQVATRELAPGVWMIGGGGYNSIAIEFAEYTTVIEAPLNERRSMAVIREVRRLVPGKPLRYVVNSHHHFDHAGGLRGYGAEDVLIITQEANFDYYEALALSLNSHSVEPDALARNPRQVHYVRVQDRRTITDGRRELRLYHVQNLDHASDMLMAFLPAEGILIQADLFESVPAGTTPAATPRNMTLLSNIQRVSIKPTRMVSIHSGEIPMADFLRVVGQREFVASGEGLDAALNEGR
ncbi:MAG: MBL fold metallo-hydrolase [Alphaproteobacteria bacterium]|nr:MBL fold metallo-hydrolase [Alphaproteobacteria bacterium]